MLFSKLSFLYTNTYLNITIFNKKIRLSNYFEIKKIKIVFNQEKRQHYLGLNCL